MNIKAISFLILSLFILGSCKKNPGKGGTSSIKGIVETKQYDDEGVLFSTHLAANKDIFIVYGGVDGNEFMSDKITSNYNGTFKFDYLEKGKYTIYAYEDCLSCPDGKEIKQVEVAITSRKSESDLGTISLVKYKDPSGSATIKGYLHVMNYDNSGAFVNEGPGGDEDVFLIFGESTTNYTEKVKTNLDGTFEFQKLPNGKYKVYAFEKCNTCANGNEAVQVLTEITVTGSTVDIGQLTIKK